MGGERHTRQTLYRLDRLLDPPRRDADLSRSRVEQSSSQSLENLQFLRFAGRGSSGPRTHCNPLGILEIRRPAHEDECRDRPEINRHQLKIAVVIHAHA